MPDLSTYLFIGILAYVGALLITVIWPSFGFAALVTIPLFKVIFRQAAPGLLTGYTYDMAVVMLAIVGALVYRLRSGGGQTLPIPSYVVVAWFVIMLLMWLRLPASRDMDYGFKKAVIFSVFNTLTVATIPLLLLRPSDVKRFLRVFLWIGAAAGLAMPLFGAGIAEWEGARQSIAGASPLAVADLCSQAVIILLTMLIASQTPRMWLAVLTIAPLCILGILLSGTRGAILGIVVIVPLMFWFYRREVSFPKAMGSMVALAVVGAAAILVLDPNRLYRFRPEVMRQGFEHRMERTTVGLQGFAANPILGSGPGDYGVQFFGMATGSGSHPHNHLIEVANELGVFGLTAWLIIMITALRAGWQLSRREWNGTEAKALGTPLFMVFAYYLLMSFKAGSFSGSYMLWFFAITTICLWVLRQRDVQAWRQQMTQFLLWQRHQSANARAATPARAAPAPNG